jgi:hypothetical protein
MPPIQPYALILFLLFIAPSAVGQTLIFPDLKGEALIEALRNTYRPNVVLSYSNARDELFSYTANADSDTLRCVYSGYAIYLPINEDPSSYAYDNGIDTEHTYPQSKGAADQPAKSDMHHLFPVRSNVNSSRGNDPYAEIPDAQTDKWYRKNYSATTIPSTDIDQYSEHDDQTQTFEPREDHKGNAARAVFYFYTMYQAEATTADPAFFDLQKQVLYQWHRQDLSDSREQLRNEFIASMQEGKPNPFILDSSLVQRAYFPNDTATVPITPSNPTDSVNIIQYAAPNPSLGDITIKYNLPDDAEQVLIEIFDLQGKLICQLLNEAQEKGEQSAVWNAQSNNGNAAAEGLYIARLHVLMNDQIRQEKTFLVVVR